MPPGLRRAARAPRPTGSRRSPDRLALGIDPVAVWEQVARDPELAPLGRAMARAQRSGAPVAATVERLADELATSGRAEIEDRARAVGVKAAVPLGVCLLPSFLLLGIVPMVAVLVSELGSDLPRQAATRPPQGALRTGRSTAGSAAVAHAVRPDGESRWRGRTGGPSRGDPMNKRTDDDGITTAEYAVGTAAGAGLAGLLYQLLTGGFGDQLLRSLFDHVLGLLGIG